MIAAASMTSVREPGSAGAAGALDRTVEPEIVAVDLVRTGPLYAACDRKRLTRALGDDRAQARHAVSLLGEQARDKVFKLTLGQPRREHLAKRLDIQHSAVVDS